jgi:hypothetical protein
VRSGTRDCAGVKHKESRKRYLCAGCRLVHGGAYPGPMPVAEPREFHNKRARNFISHEVNWRYSPKDLERMRWGFVPSVPEERWYVYTASDRLFLHRSMSGMLFYVIHLDEKGIRRVDVKRSLNLDDQGLNNFKDMLEGLLIGSPPGKRSRRG